MGTGIAQDCDGTVSCYREQARQAMLRNDMDSAIRALEAAQRIHPDEDTESLLGRLKGYRRMHGIGDGVAADGDEVSDNFGRSAVSKDNGESGHRYPREQCQDDDSRYEDGSFTRCLHQQGQFDCLAQGYFVCRQGSWSREKAPPLEGVHWRWSGDEGKQSFDPAMLDWTHYPGDQELLNILGLKEKHVVRVEDERGEKDRYLRREGGIAGVYYWLEDGDGNEIRTAEALGQWAGGVDSSTKAMLFVHALIADTRVFAAARTDEGYLVFALDKQTFGCGTHVPRRMLYRVTLNGEIEPVAEEDVPVMPQDRSMMICVD